MGNKMLCALSVFGFYRFFIFFVLPVVNGFVEFEERLEILRSCRRDELSAG
jgi:hypothetical protein